MNSKFLNFYIFLSVFLSSAYSYAQELDLPELGDRVSGAGCLAAPPRSSPPRRCLSFTLHQVCYQVSLDREAPAQECLATRQENSDTCGILGSPAKIVGGEEARRHQYTWLAMLTLSLIHI